MANRKYFKIIATRIPPWYPINESYKFEEHVYAFSKEGAENTFYKRYRKCYGHHYIDSITEISKDEFKGHHWDKAF